jgi:hypothetical protein
LAGFLRLLAGLLIWILTLLTGLLIWILTLLPALVRMNLHFGLGIQHSPVPATGGSKDRESYRKECDRISYLFAYPTGLPSAGLRTFHF